MFQARAIIAVSLAALSVGMTSAFGAGAAAASTTSSPPSAASGFLESANDEPRCGGEQPAKPDGGVYTCTFTDDFTGSTLDPANWAIGTTAQIGFTGGECYVDDPGNVSVSDGSLHLTSRVEPRPFTCRSPYGNFTTTQTAGSVMSSGKFAQTYGRFEFQARFPSADTADFNSALWMYPQKPAYGAWPKSGEIDVAEWFGSPYGNRRAFPSVHYAGENPALSTGFNCVLDEADKRFHRYAVNWTATTMYFYYDNQLCFQHSWAPGMPLLAPKPFDNAFYMVMTQSGRKSAAPGSSLTMDVDWVRVWR